MQDAEFLLTHVTGYNKAWFLAHLDDEMPLDQADLYGKLIRRRLAGEPIQYIAGETEFYGLPFRVTPAVLIPRPETEHLVEEVLQRAAHFTHPRILDIGTGSGCIAIAFAHHLPNAAITTIDLSPDALEIARQNAAIIQVAGRIRFLQGDLLAPLAGETFDIIVSNPPYVPSPDRDTLSVEVRDHEPALALFAGEDGLDIYRRLVPAALAALAPNGYLLLEIGYGQSGAVTEILASAGFQSIETIPDLQGIPRVLCATRGHA
jgi:release factor glutamine methyltransferase